MKVFTQVKPTEQVVVGVSLILKGESTVTDVIQILQPLKVWNCHTTGVQIHVLTEETRTEETRRGDFNYLSAFKNTKNTKVPLTFGRFCVFVCISPTGITMMFLSRKMRSASAVVGPLAPSATIWNRVQVTRVSIRQTQDFLGAVFWQIKESEFVLLLYFMYLNLSWFNLLFLQTSSNSCFWSSLITWSQLMEAQQAVYVCLLSKHRDLIMIRSNYSRVCVTLALTLCALFLVSCFSLAAGIRMSHSASRMLPSYGVASGKPTIVPLA